MALGKDDDGLTLEEFKVLPEEAAPPEDIQGKPFLNEHAARLKSPGLYKRFRRQNDKFGSGVHAIWGVRRDNDKVDLQALRFAVAKFTVVQARAWLKEHDYTAIRVEPASGKEVDPERNSPEPPSDSRDVKPEPDILNVARHERVLAAEDAKLAFGKAGAENFIEGYASAFDIKDRQGEIVKKGAFVKTIAERGTKGKIPLMAKHFALGAAVTDAVGVITELSEDDYGLRFRAEWIDTEHAKQVRTAVNALHEKGVRVGTSIGFWRDQFTISNENGEHTLIHTSIKLAEVTITLKPANEGAYVTGSKSLDTALQTIYQSGPEALDGETGRLLQELGGREKAEELVEGLETFAGKIKDLIAATQPQDTKSDAGSTEPGDSAAAADDVADLHSLHARVEALKRKARCLTLT